MISHPPLSSSSSSARPSPRQLQGPRPSPLKIRKDSYKINKKAPAAALPTNDPNPPPPRPPVIIYTVSPKIIHAKPSDFMTLVQRLTGPDSLGSPSARFAAIETAGRFSSPIRAQQQQHEVHVDDGEGSSVLMVERGAAAAAATTGILSPMPSSLLPISSSFFSPIMSSSSSPSFDAAAGTFGFLQDLSPGPNAGFLISPHSLLSSTPTTVPSPGAPPPIWDHIFNYF